MAQLFQLVRDQDRIADDATEQDRRDKHGQNSACAAFVEMRNRKRALLQLAPDDVGDQIARDDKEDIDPDKASAEPWEIEVEQDHRQNRDGPQAVDIRAVFHMACGAGRGHRVSQINKFLGLKRRI